MKTLTPEQIEELRSQTVSHISVGLSHLERRELVALLAAETDQKEPRKTLVEVITDEIAKRDAEGDVDEPKDEALEAKPLPWQAPDYEGPLDIAQSEWRRANIKPVTAVTTK